ASLPRRPALPPAAPPPRASAHRARSGERVVDHAGPDLRRGRENRALTPIQRAAITMISTSARGSASFASTQARAGSAALSTHAVHTSFVGARLRMSLTQISAERSLDLLVPHCASRR